LNVLKWLVEEQGMDITVKTKSSRTPLLIAAEQGNARLVEYLLKQDVNSLTVDAVDDFLRTPLMHAARKGCFYMTQLLIAAGAQTNLKDGYQRTALIHASKFGHQQVVDFLIKFASADLSETEKQGRTGFVYAAEAGQFNTVDWFLENAREAKQPEQVNKALEVVLKKQSENPTGSPLHSNYFDLGKFLYYTLRRQHPSCEPKGLTKQQMLTFDGKKQEQVMAYAKQIRGLICFYDLPAINSIIGSYLDTSFNVHLDNQERRRIASYISLRDKVDALRDQGYIFKPIANPLEVGSVPTPTDLSHLIEILKQVRTSTATTGDELQTDPSFTLAKR
jgi:hypothetical protein